MDIIGIYGIVATVIVAVIAEYFGYRRRNHSESDRQERARKETTALIKRMLSGTGQPQADIAEILIRNKYKECGVKSANAINKLPDILEGIIKELYDNEYVPEAERDKIVGQANKLKLALRERKSNLQEALLQMKQASLLAVISDVGLTFFGGLMGGIIVFLITIIILGRLNQHATFNVNQFLVVLAILVLETAILEYRRLWNRRLRALDNLNLSLEDTVIGVIQQDNPQSQIERQAQITIDGSLKSVEMVISVDNQKLPIEIRTGKLRQSDIKRLSSITKAFVVDKSLLVTHLRTSQNILKTSESLGVLVLDRVTSDSDLARQLKFVKLFKK